MLSLDTDLEAIPPKVNRRFQEMSNTETAQLITRMPVSLRRELKHLATDRNTSMSVVVRDAIVRMVGEAQRAEDGSRG